MNKRPSSDGGWTLARGWRALLGSDRRQADVAQLVARIKDSRLFDAAAYSRLNKVSGSEDELIQHYVRNNASARPEGHAERAAAFYDLVAASYDGLVANHWAGPNIAFGLIYPRFRAGETIVDLGVGTGLSAASFHRAGGRIIGLDASRVMLDKCRERGTCARVIEWDLAKTPYPLEANSADHVVCSGAAHFLGNIGEFVGEAARLLRTNGFFYFDVMHPARDEKITAAGGLVTAVQLKVHFHEHTDLLALFAHNGLQLVTSFPFLIVEEVFKTDGFVGTARFGFRAYLCKRSA